jgi:hypothetical protein
MIHYDKSARRCSFVWAAHNMLKDRAGLVINPQKLDTIIGDAMEYEWQDIVYDPNDYDMDTAPRENVFDLVSEHYLGHPWPMIMDNMDINDYFMRLEAEIEKDR